MKIRIIDHEGNDHDIETDEIVSIIPIGLDDDNFVWLEDGNRFVVNSNNNKELLNWSCLV